MYTVNRKSICMVCIIFAILITGLVLRLHDIEKYDLWFDEAMSDAYSFELVDEAAQIYNTSRWRCLNEYIIRDPHSALYGFFVYTYSFLCKGECSLRVLSVIFSMLLLWVFYKFARLFFSRKISIFAILIMAISPMQVWYAQEARAYMMASFFSVLMAYSCVKALRSNKIFYWMLFVVSSICAIYTNFNSLLLIIVLMVAVFFDKRQRWNGMRLLSFFLIAIFALPLFYYLANNYASIKHSFWLPIPTIRSIFMTPVVFVFGYSATLWQICIGQLLFISLYAFGAYSYFCVEKKKALFLFAFSFLPIIAIYAFSKFFISIYIDRRLLVFAPFYYLFIAYGVESLKNAVIKRALVIVVIILITMSLVNFYRGFMLSYRDGRDFYVGVHKKKNYRHLFNEVKKEAQKGDIMVVADWQSFIVELPYLTRFMQNDAFFIPKHLFLYPAALNDYEKRSFRIDNFIKQLDDDQGDYLYHTRFFHSWPKNMSAVKGINEYKRIWFFLFPWETGRFTRNSLMVKEYLSSNYKRTIAIEEDGVYLELYIRE